MTALFEADRDQLPEKIRHAEGLITKRKHEVVGLPGTMLERSALNKAFHALHALRLCLNLDSADTRKEELRRSA